MATDLTPPKFRRQFSISIFKLKSKILISAEWLTNFVGMYVPIIENLLHRSDTTLCKLAKTYGIKESLADHQHEMLSVVKIDRLRDIQVLETEWTRRKMPCSG